MSRSDTRIHLISADPMQYSKLLKGPLIGLDCEWVNNTEKRNGKVVSLCQRIKLGHILTYFIIKSKLLSPWQVVRTMLSM